MELSTEQRFVVAKLVGYCEAIVAIGKLSEPNEESLRLLIAETLTAFGMHHHDNLRQLENPRSIV